MQLATLLGRSKSKDSQEILDTLEITEAKLDDWHVWVQIVRAQAALSLSTEGMLPQFLEYLSAKNDHIKITSLQTLRASASQLTGQSILIDSLRLTLSSIINNTAGDEAVRGESIVTLGKYFPKDLMSFYTWIHDEQVTPRLKAKLLEGVAQQITKEHLNILSHNLNHESNRVEMAAWDFIRPMLNPAVIKKLGFDSSESAALSKEIYNESKNALAKNDMGVTTVVANLFSDANVFKNFISVGCNHQIVDNLISAFKNLTHTDDLEAKQAILQTLENIKDTNAVIFLEKELSETEQSIAAEAAASLHSITGKDYSGRLHQQTIPQRTEEDWNLLERIKPNQGVRIITNRGELTIELMKEQAPFTVLNLVKLIKNKFYDGLYFHRVVPDFVVQGGDPRGDGWGGPGYQMRTEISTVNYERGSCGMASAGKDTEGSQFFITHISVPHLDGRYTIFAKVVKGMDVVDRLQIGDTIQAIRLVEE